MAIPSFFSTSCSCSFSIPFVAVVSFFLKVSLFLQLVSPRALASPYVFLPLSVHLSPSSVLHLLLPFPVLYPYRGTLGHSMVHPVLHIMYPTAVSPAPLPPSPFFTGLAPPLMHVRRPVQR